MAVATEKPKIDTEQKTRLTPRFKVLLHNDDVTTMNFVVDILVSIFHRNHQDAIKIMLEVHNEGVGLAAVLTQEEAEFRIEQAVSKARTAKFPLALTMEPE